MERNIVFYTEFVSFLLYFPDQLNAVFCIQLVLIEGDCQDCCIGLRVQDKTFVKWQIINCVFNTVDFALRLWFLFAKRLEFKFFQAVVF